MPVNRVRVLPDIPKNMANMENLIQEFETDFCSTSANCRNTGLKSSTLSNGNFVKKIVEVYESSVRVSNENSQRKQVKERSDFFNTLDVTQNRKKLEKSGSSLAIYDLPSSQCRNNFNKESKFFSIPFEAREVEDDLVIINRYRSVELDRKTGTRPGSSFKSKMSSFMDDLPINVQFGSSKWSETIWDLEKRDKKLEGKPMKNKLIICSSPLKDVEDDDMDWKDPLDDISTNSCDSSGTNSYKNLQADLYDFDDEQWQSELSSTSLSSSKTFLGLTRDNMLSSDDSNLLDSSFQDVSVTSSKDISKNRGNLQDSKFISSPSCNFIQKSPPAIGASLNENRPIGIDSDNCTTAISALGEKLSRVKSLKKLLRSAFNTKLLNYKNVWKKKTERQPNEHTTDSGFIERLSFSSSSFSQKSWRSDPDERSSTLEPTFGTFGRAKNTCVNGKTSSKSIVLTEVPREEFTREPQPSKSIPLNLITISGKENRRNVESLLQSTMFVSSSKLKASCEYPPLPKHPYLTRNGIPKHSFVAKTKLDQTMEKESVEKEEMRCDAKEHESDTRESEGSGMSSVSQADLNILYSRMSGWLTSSPDDNCDLLRSRTYKSTSALDGFVPQQTSIRSVPKLCHFSTDFLSTLHNVCKEPCIHRYATVRPKNLRFSMSREKLRAIEKNFDI